MNSIVIVQLKACNSLTSSIIFPFEKFMVLFDKKSLINNVSRGKNISFT